MLKKGLSLVLVLVFAITAVPLVGFLEANAANWQDVLSYEEDYEGTGIVITDCAEYASGGLTIPASINGLPVTSIGDEAFYNCAALTSVIIPDSVTSIGYEAFVECAILSSVKLSKSLETIGSHAFYNCDNLISIEIPKSLEGVDTDYYGPFSGCSNLRNVTFETGTTKICADLFSGCDGITSIIIPDTVIRIGYSAFAECTILSSVKLSKSLETMGYDAFYNCDNLISIEIPKSLEGVESDWGDDYGPFRGCSNLRNVTFETGTIKICNNLFWGCDGLVNLIIPDTVTSIETSAFNYCKALTSITVSDSVTSIGYFAFAECTKLSSVKLSKSLETMGYDAFYNCDNLISIEIPKSLERVDADWGDDYGPFGGCSNLRNVTFETGTIKICNNLFGGCDGLVNLIVPDTVTSIESGAFYNCAALTSITIPNKIAQIPDSCFSECTALTSITIPNSVMSIGDGAFSKCTALTSITIPDSVTSIGESTFYDCTKLTNAKLSDKMKIIPPYCFSGCKALTKVILPSVLTDIYYNAFYNNILLSDIVLPDTLKTIGSYAFENNDALTQVVLPKNVTEIGYKTFYDCDLLSKVVIPNSVTTLGSYAFYGCDALSDISFGTGLTEIPDSAFRLCFALNDVTLPRYLKIIGANAFAENTNLKNATIFGKVTSIENNSFSYPAKMKITGIPGTYAQNYAASRSITFVPIPDTITAISFAEAEIVFDRRYQTKVLNLNITPVINSDSVTFTSSNTDVVVVADDMATSVGPGTAIITARTNAGLTATCSVTVLCPADYVSLNKTSLLLNVGATETLTATLDPLNSTDSIVFTSSDKKIATVDSTGKVTAVALGSATITATATSGAYKTCAVSVVTLNGITIKTNPTKMSYYVGDTLNTAGLTITATYSNGSTQTVSTGFTCSPTTLTTAGTQTITVTYQGKTTTFNVTVTAVALSSIAVKTNPTKTSYYVGDTLNTAGLTLTATYNNGTTQTISSGFTCSPTTLTTAGTQPVTVTYQGKTTTFSVTVMAVAVSSIAVKTNPTKTSYYVGDTLDTTGLTLTATYNNGTTQTITSGFTCSPTTLNTAGTQTITVTYSGKTTAFNVTVTAVSVSGIVVKTNPTKTSYYVGDTLNTSGLTLTATYSNGSTQTVSSGFTCSPTTLSTAGTQPITVTYQGKTTTFNVTVTAIALSGIAVNTAPTKTSYFVGDTLDTTGLSLTATYNNGRVDTVYIGYTCSPTALNTAGTQTITVTYSGKTTTFNVTVTAVTLSNIVIKTKPTKTSYYVGDTFDATGLTLTATYNNGTTQTITTGFTCSPTTLSTAGTQTITVTYNGKTTSFNLTVAAVSVSGIAVKTNPTKTSYYVGDTLNTTGLTLTATYNNGTTQTVSSGFTCSPTTLNTAGTQLITVTYGGKTTTFNVTVTAAAVSGIAVKTNPTKISYYVGDTLNTAGLTLTATYNNGTTQIISTGFTCSPTALNTAGTQAITVTYQGKTTTFNVTVVSNANAPKLTVSSQKAAAGQTVNITISVSNNPGIIAARFAVNYDKTKLKLVKVTNGSLIGASNFSPGNDLTVSPYYVCWEDALAATNYTGNGVLVTLSFEVRQGAALGVTPVALTLDGGSTFNKDLNAVSFAVSNGNIEITDRTPGDANEDNVVDLKDVVLIRRWLAGGWGVTINQSNADVNGDSIVDLKDVVLIRRYLAGGWNVVLV